MRDPRLAPSPAAPAVPVASHVLAEVTAGLSSGDDLRQLLPQLLRPIAQLAGAAAAAVRLLPRNDGLMQLAGSFGLPAAVLAAEQSVPSACGSCGAALAAGQPVWDDDVAACSRHHAQRETPPYFGAGCRRMLAVPLQHRGRALGVLNLYFEGLAAPAPEVQALLKTLGELIGMALDKARLEQESLEALVMRERQAIAADVHDSIGQSLTFVKMRMPLLHDAMRSGDSAGAERYYQDVRSAVADAHASLRGILTQFRTPVDPLGLAHALEAGAETFRRQSGAELQLRNELPALRLPPEREVQVFHVVQEALNNVVRHAAARHAWLHVAAQGDHAEFVIEDDGSGLPPQAGAEGSHYGLAIMRERASRLGGTLSVGPREGGGTCVRLRVPLPATPEAH